MENKDVSCFSCVLFDFILKRNQRLSDIDTLNKLTINSFVLAEVIYYKKVGKTIAEQPLRFLEISKEAESINRLSSGDLNVFRMFGVDEKRHSYIIANLLNPLGEHGQKNLFLNIFLDMLKIERKSDNEIWVVTAEKGRIDILLKRVYPNHSVVVIENKSNYASDQTHQLYRYWYKEIYQTICSKHLPNGYILDPPSRFYQLIYLSPSQWKIPSNNSLERPENWDSRLPDRVPMVTNHLLFSVFIVNWLNASLEKLPLDNHRIQEYVKQYIEFWT